MLLPEATVEQISDELAQRSTISFVLAYRDRETGDIRMRASTEVGEELVLTSELLEFIEENVHGELEEQKEQFREIKEKYEEESEEEEPED